MERIAFVIVNAKGEFARGRTRCSSGWTTDFSRARLFGRRSDAANADATVAPGAEIKSVTVTL